MIRQHVTPIKIQNAREGQCIVHNGNVKMTNFHEYHKAGIQRHEAP